MIRPKDLVLLLFALSIISIFYHSLRLPVGENILPLSVLMILPGFILISLKLARGGRMYVPKEVVWCILVLAFYALSDMLRGTLGGKLSIYPKLCILPVILFIIINLLDENNLDLILRAFILMGIIICVLGYFRGFEPGKYYLNIFEDGLRSKNASAFSILIFICLIAPYLFNYDRPLFFSKQVDLCIFLFFLLSMTLTLSRGGIIASVFPFFIQGMRLKRIRRLIIAIIIGGGIFLTGNSGELTTQYKKRIMSITEYSYNPKDVESSNATRVLIAIAGLRMIGDSPIIGYGYHSFSTYMIPYMFINPRFLAGEHNSISSPHIQYLDIAIQGGIISLFFFMLIFWRLYMFRKTIVFPNAHTGIITLGIPSVLLYFCFAFPFERILFWIFLAICLVILKIES